MKQRKILWVAVTSMLLMLLFCLPLWAAETEAVEGVATDLAPLQEMIDQIEQRALNPVDKQKLIDGALKGMMEALDDEHSVYFNAEERQAFDNHVKGSFGAIGVIMGQRSEGITVLKVLEDMPAASTNIQKGDIIYAVNGEILKDANTTEAANLIRGEAGTGVTISVLHADRSKEDVEIVRANYEINPVHMEMLEDQIGYVRIDTFSENTKKNFNQAIADLKEQNCRGLVLDLRDNPGGLLTAGLDIASILTPKGKLLTVQGRDGKVVNAYQSLVPKIMDVPLAVLINENSASASEIVTGAVKDYGTGTIVGKTSYGKATMQQVIPLSNGGEMKLTYAHYLTPDGNLIDGKGIIPDVVVEDTRVPTKPASYALKGTLAYRSRGADVKALQAYLNRLNFNAGKADGIFGPRTLQAVKAMQKAYGLAVTGKVDQAVMNDMLAHLPTEKVRDAQLEKAVEILKGKIKAKNAA